MTHNSSNRSHEGLMLETSAFKLFTVANLRHQLCVKAFKMHLFYDEWKLQRIAFQRKLRIIKTLSLQ